MRNKAAEKAKISGYGSGGCTSPELTPGLSHEGGHTSLRHPSYSINGILGIHQQQDANANIQSRKREAEGKWSEGWGSFGLMMMCSDEKGQGRLQEEDCKRFRSQYDPALYSSMWSGKWGSVPHIKEEKSASQSLPEQSPTNSESQYGSTFPAGSGAFTGTNTNTSQASNNEILYETMSQVYPALSSSLGTLTLSHQPHSFISIFQFQYLRVAQWAPTTTAPPTSTPPTSRTLSTRGRGGRLTTRSQLRVTPPTPVLRAGSLQNNYLIQKYI